MFQMILLRGDYENSIILKKISSLFQYSERTDASTETKNTSAESSLSQLFGARKNRAWQDQGAPRPLGAKDLEQSKDAKI